MAVFFADGQTDKITVTNPLTYGAGTEFTYQFWFKRLSPPSTSRGWSKGVTHDLLVFSDSGYYFSNVGRATTASESRVATANLFDFDVWECIGITYSESSGVQIFRGTLTSTMTECAYTLQEIGSGDTTANSGDLYINNRSAAATLSIGGTLGSFLMFNRRLTLGELRRNQFRPAVSSGCLVYYNPYNTSTVTDLSGNGRNGTGTGIIVADHVPLGPMFGVNEEITFAGAIMSSINGRLIIRSFPILD